MIQIHETVFSKNIFIKTRAMYLLSLDIMDNMSTFDEIKEKTNLLKVFNEALIMTYVGERKSAIYDLGKTDKESK